MFDVVLLSRPQNSFYNQLHKQKKSEKFFKVFYDRMEQAQKEIRSSVSVNMFELSCRRREDEGEGLGMRHKKGKHPRTNRMIIRLLFLQDDTNESKIAEMGIWALLNCLENMDTAQNPNAFTIGFIYFTNRHFW